MTGMTGVTGRATVRPHELVERALELSGADETAVIVEENSSVNLRWAGNALTTNGTTRGRQVTVVASVDGATGTAAGVVSRSGVAPGELAELVAAAERAARAAGPVEDAQPLVGPGASGGEFEAPPQVTSPSVLDGFAEGLGEAFRAARDGGRELFGFASHTVASTYLGTSAGARLRYDRPEGTAELNAKSPDRLRSAWANRATDDFRDVDVLAMDGELARRLAWAQRSVALPAGRYETVLPPVAVADLLIYLHWMADVRDAAEGRTVFSAPGGGTRVGERLTRLPMRLYSDPAEPGLEVEPFVVAHSTGGAVGSGQSVFDNGAPLERAEWISDGTLRALPGSRYAAGVTGVPSALRPDNLILDAGSSATTEELIAGTERGLLLTCLWYIREVDPRNLLMTGLTRDGVYLVENGEITGAVNNFRFNESPLGVLGRATEAGRTERCLSREWGDWFGRSSMPALRVPEFHMSSVSPGV